MLSVQNVCLLKMVDQYRALIEVFHNSIHTDSDHKMITQSNYANSLF